MDKFNKEADIKESHIKFRRCTEMSIIGEPNISYSALYENNPSMESFQNLRAKSSLKNLSHNLIYQNQQQHEYWVMVPRRASATGPRGGSLGVVVVVRN